MDHFLNAKVVRLRSHHRTYLTAEDDEEDSVRQHRDGAARGSRWTVELVDGGRSSTSPRSVRLRSFHGSYLAASDKRFPMTGRRVLLTRPGRLDPSVEWEPMADSSRVKLRTRDGTFLRANGAVRPWKNSVTHDVPHRTMTQEWVFWDVDVLEMRDDVSPVRQRPDPLPSIGITSLPYSTPSHASGSIGAVSAVSPATSGSTSPSHEYYSSSASSSPASSPPRPPTRTVVAMRSVHDRGESWSGSPRSPATPHGRTIRYYIADENGEVDDSYEGRTFFFRGSCVAELTRRVEEETMLRDVILCRRDVLDDDKLQRLRLSLPPNSAPMTVVVVRSGTPAWKGLNT